MKTTLFRISWSVLFLVSISQSTSSEKVGRCPAGTLDNKLCRDQIDQCQNDNDCNGDSLCCSTGCNRICMLPSFTACDHSRMFFEKQFKNLTPEEANSTHVPKCNDAGNFEEIQCNNAGICWCVDGFGFEKGGTRANSRDAVNCTRSNEKCNGPQCRMLCPYGFELDEEGCEMCICKDICKGIKCPGSLECQLQEVSCASEPCPPVPTCKKARTLESLCTVGVPFTIPENGNPFLCGTTPGKPTCPVGFTCNVNSGDDYGVCCGSEAFYEKPGLCPVISTADTNCDDSKDENNCRSSCKHDFECTEMKKCCMTAGRGKQCTDALNSTLCLQQRKIAEIFSTKEIEGRGYIPQCEPNGDFVKKQCSRNGKICWCVDENGRNVPQSLSLAEFVNCTNIAKRRDLVDDSACDINLCANICEFGFKTDEGTGCATCDCNLDPCSSLKCPEGSHCAYTGNQQCEDPSKCYSQPTCVPNVLHVNPCDNGTPLLDHSSNQLVVCSENGATCPSSHVCVKASVNTDGLCCLNRPRLEPTKPGMCPFISASLCNGTLQVDNKQCSSDKECEGDMKCCGLPCGAICADPLLDAQTETNKMPTMCQYLENVEMKQNEVLKNFKMAIDVPKCKKSGEFEEIQCNEKWCYCIDEFGIEIDSTRVLKENSNLTSDLCMQKRIMSPCLDMTCRLGCDYGYQLKDNCRVCECVNPCDKNKICDEDHFCEMVDMDCADGYCPPVPYCIPKAYAAIANSQQLASGKSSCPKGIPYFDVEANETLTCRPRARMLQCPDDYYCHELHASNHDAGYCCPIEIDGLSNMETREGAGRFPVLSDDNILEDEFSNNNRKTRLTDCELARERHMDMTLQNQRINYIPRCNPLNGEWEQIQCIDEVNMCWCVNNQGKTVAGSITSGKPVCNFRQSRGKFLGAHTKVDQPICADGVMVHVCNKSLCDNKICMAHPGASCGIDPCGGCHVKFYDQNKNILNCDAGLGNCQKEVQRVMNSGAWINQQKQSNSPGDEEDLPIEHIIEDVLQERVGRAVTSTGSFPFSTVGELLADAMKHSSVEHFGAKVSEFFLESDSSPFASSIFPESLQISRSLPFSHQNPSRTTTPIHAFSTMMPVMMRKASCPHPSPDSILFRLTGTCLDLCNYDDECQQDERCCLVDCGYRCHKVAVEVQVQVVEGPKGISSSLESMMGEDEESNMLLLPPTCKSNGEYEPMQSQGDLAWCVDPEGNPQTKSFTRGFVVCSPEGKVIEKRSIGNICPDSTKAPTVCTDQCLKTKCSAHPDAICVTDPCDSCKVSFFSPSGEKVLCENKCLQPVDPGLCRASFAKYFYNSTGNRCEEFSWGGCQGNENNFETYEECTKECNAEVDVCSLVVKSDGCGEELSERWYFDTESDKCVSTIGCNGNKNGFKTKEFCESQCPFKVLCPNIIDGTLAICNRAEACRNITKNCRGLKDDEYICNVEPCSCTAQLQRTTGGDVICEEGEETSDSKESSQFIEKVTTTETPLSRSLEDEGIAIISERIEISENLPTATSSKDLLMVKSDFFKTKTRCLSMKDKYFTKCDDEGNFVPTQCGIDEPICWCVDSAGNQVEKTTTFLAGTSSCPTVSIDKVDVRLSFPISTDSESGTGSQMGVEMQDLLRSLDASLVEDKVSIETAEGFLNVDFILTGESAVHISHMLEEGLKQNFIGALIQNQFIPVDLSSSRFHFMVTESNIPANQEDTTTISDYSDNITDGNDIEANSILGRSDDSVTAEEVNGSNKGLNIVAICLTVAAAITAVLIIIGLFLGLQNNKKISENRQKNSKFKSLPFTSPFEFEKNCGDSTTTKISKN